MDRLRAESKNMARDAAGLVLLDNNLLQLYQSAFATGPLSSVDQLPRPYLVAFALAAGVYQTFPPDLAVRLAHWSPSAWLRRQVRYTIHTIEDDDNALLLQREASFGEPTTHGVGSVVATLSEIELMDGCLMRGLPVGDDDEADAPTMMRECLANHLNMIASLEKQWATTVDHRTNMIAKDDGGSRSGTGQPPPLHLGVNEEAMGLFSLHLAILRSQFSNSR